MHKAGRYIKSVTENIFGVKIFRNSLPFGTIIANDLEKYFTGFAFKTVFDVGANVGQSALKYIKQFPQSEIYCFEPVEKTFKELQKNVGVYSNVHTYNMAFGKEASVLEMVIHDDSCINSFVNIWNEKNLQAIPVHTLAEFTRQQKIDRINFLKIDTEGFDLNVLIGAQDLLERKAIDIIQVECGFNDNKIQVNIMEFQHYLEKFDYALFGIYDQQTTFCGDPWLLMGNAIFVRKNIAK